MNTPATIMLVTTAFHFGGGCRSGHMSALGHKQTFRPFNAMSALPPKADILGGARMSAKCTEADIGCRSRKCLSTSLLARLAKR